MIPEGYIKNTLLGGFEKHSAEAYLQQILDRLNQLESQAGFPLTKFDKLALKKAKIGSGYDKKSVLTYILQLQEEILMLEDTIKN
ncbi:MAG: hypothetical protein IJJ69_08740 [Oscillospiraceae bacterium]|nr:hypothetical protein [Oscillospiraceae bacterium]